MAIDTPHAFAASAGDCLDQDRVTDLVGFLLEKFWFLHLPVIAGDDWNPGLLHDRLGAVLQTHGANGIDRWADKSNPSIEAGLGKFDIFRKKSVSGMDTGGTRGPGACDNFVD